MLAHAVIDCFKASGIQFDVLCRPKFDAKQFEHVKFGVSKYDYVVNCIGLTNRWQDDTDEKTFIKINSHFPQFLSKKCVDEGSRLIHISTDCVFSGKNGPYVEDSYRDGTGIYSKSKIKGEPIENSLVLRTSIIGPEIHNFYSLLHWVFSKEGETIRGFKNHIWNGMTTYQLAQCILTIVQRDLFYFGSRHLFSAKALSKFELIKMICDIYELKNTNVISVYAEKGKDMRLNTNFPDYISKFKIKPIDDQMRDLALMADAKI